MGFGVTFLSDRIEHGRLDGIGVYTKSLWDGLKSSKNLHPLSFSTQARIEKSQEFLNHHIDSTPTPYPIHSGISSLLNAPLGELREYEKSIDLFFAPDHHIPFLRDTPVVASVMDIIPFIHPEWASGKLRAVKNFAFKRAVKSADHIITISQHSKQDIINHFEIDEHKISTVPLGVDSRFFIRADESSIESVKSKYGIDREFFLSVGTLQPRKNILRTIEAFRRLPKLHRDDSMLVIVGQDGWGSDELAISIKKMKEDGDGIWLSYLPQDEVYALMQSASAIVYPSLYEGFGLPIVEGFASQTPVITSTTTSMPEVAGDAAILVDPYSTEEISKAMEQILDSSELSQELIAKGLEKVREYSWEISTQRHLEIFRKINVM